MEKSNGEIVSDDDNNESTESEEEVVENQSKVRSLGQVSFLTVGGSTKAKLVKLKA